MIYLYNNNKRSHLFVDKCHVQRSFILLSMWLTLIYLLSLIHLILSGKTNDLKRKTFKLISLVKYNRICYFTNWGAHRSMKEARLYPEDVPPDLCTHILYAFANLNGLSLQPQIANDINVYQGEKVF